MLGAQYQSSLTDSVPKVSARGQHADREKHDGDDADLRELSSHLGDGYGIAATGDPGKNPGRPGRPLIS